MIEGRCDVLFECPKGCIMHLFIILLDAFCSRWCRQMAGVGMAVKGKALGWCWAGGTMPEEAMCLSSSAVYSIWLRVKLISIADDELGGS